MRLSLDARALRLLRRLPQHRIFGAAELLLSTALAFALANLAWAIVTPVDPLGDWRLEDRTASAVANRATLFGAFDPFFRLEGGPAAAVVTSLQLKLFGTRLNEASGRGSAILAGPDGVQASYAVGEEIMPGVTLKAVAFDNVTIDRGGTSEQVFLDQSTPVPTAAPGATPTAPAAALSIATPAPGGLTFTPEQLQAGIQFLPRNADGRVTGLVLRAAGDGGAFRGAGFQDGDILVSVNGQPITSAADAQRLQSQLTPGSNVTLQVERGAETVPVTVTIAR